MLKQLFYRHTRKHGILQVLPVVVQLVLAVYLYGSVIGGYAFYVSGKLHGQLVTGLVIAEADSDGIALGNLALYFEGLVIDGGR